MARGQDDGFDPSIHDEARLAVLEDICGLMDALEAKRLGGLGKAPAPAAPTAAPVDEADDLAKLQSVAKE